MTLRQARKLDKRRVPFAEQRRKVGTLQRAVARLRKSWRVGNPIANRSRGTGWDQEHDDYFAANRLAVYAWRLRWARAPGGFASPSPRPGHANAEIHGCARSLS